MNREVQTQHIASPQNLTSPQTAEQTAPEVIFCSPRQLKLHPKNIRVYYPPEQVEEMARSIKARRGVIQALQIVPDPDEPGKFLVVDGNLRLMAARLLAENCPPLKCEIIAAGEAEQLLIMAATGLFYPKDPVSEGRHYRRLIEVEGLSVEAIAAQTGISRATIDARLRTLELEGDIQQLMAAGKLSADIRVSRALLSVPDPALRLRLARRFARHDTSIPQILRSCRFSARQSRRLAGQPELHPELVEGPKRPVLRVIAAAPPTNGRPAVAELPGRLSPDAAEIIWRAAERCLCDGCRLDGLSDECWTCPGPYEFVNHVIELAEARRQEKEAA